MKVLVDTAAWSLSFRRSRQDLSPAERAIRMRLEDLIRDGRAIVIGPIRQELLSGVKSREAFDRLKNRLSHFEDEPLFTADYEEAADFDRRCREAALGSSPTDLLICAVAIRLGAAVLTLDRDFEGYARVLRVSLHDPSA